MSYDTWKTTNPRDADPSCIRDDSTDCDCPRCRADEDRFWAEQGGQPDVAARTKHKRKSKP